MEREHKSSGISAQIQTQNRIHGEDQDTHLDKALQRLDLFLSFLGFHQTSILSFVVSWAAFVVVGVVIPVVVLELNSCSYDCLASQACLGGVCLVCLSHNLRKYGVRKFLFVDRYSGHMARLMDQYVHRIEKCYRVLIIWLLPCLILKIAREVIRVQDAQNKPRWQSTAIVTSLVLSWTYLNTISLSACMLFHLICNLQVIHFDDYANLLQREPDILLLIDEHTRLRHHLTEISHRFRIYLLLVFLVVTASQFVTLLQTTGYSGAINFLDGGDFAGFIETIFLLLEKVTSIVQVVGITLCLHAATKISHRAQAIASVAAKWHALSTNASSEPPQPTCLNHDSLSVNLSESDLDSSNCYSASSAMESATLVSSYHKRASFVMYLQMNPGGITVFGWRVDRGLVCTIFFIELSLVLFVLGKTVVFSIDPSPGAQGI